MWCCFLQEQPDIGRITTVTPSPDKVEVARLKNDIPKYYPFLQPGSKLLWECFLEKELDKLTTFSTPPTEFADLHRRLISAASIVTVEDNQQDRVEIQAPGRRKEVIKLIRTKLKIYSSLLNNLMCIRLTKLIQLNWLEKYIVYVNLFTNPISAFSELF